MSNEIIMEVMRLEHDNTMTVYTIRDGHVSIAYGTCYTAANTTTKAVTLAGDSDWKLKAGSLVTVLFANAVPANATLKVGDFEAKPIYNQGNPIFHQAIMAGNTATFMYDGTRFNLTALDAAGNSGNVSYVDLDVTLIQSDWTSVTGGYSHVWASEYLTNDATVDIAFRDGVRDGLVGDLQYTKTLGQITFFTDETPVGNIPLSVRIMSIDDMIDGTAIESKADKTDTVLNTTLSRGRKLNTTAGTGSIAFGETVEASAPDSQAFGSNTKAAGRGALASGIDTTAVGQAADVSGTGTKASSRSQHVVGEYNVDDLANSNYDRGEFVEIVGNGSDVSHPSNARTVDWYGNERIGGDLYIESKPDSTGGVAVGQFLGIADIQEYSEQATYELGEMRKRNGAVYVCTTPIAAAESWNSSHWRLRSLVTEIDSRFASYELSFADIETLLGTPSSGAPDLVTRISSVESDITDLNTKIGTPTVGSNDVVTRLGSVESDVFDLQGVVGTPASGADDLVTRIGAAESDISDLETALGTPASGADDLVTRVTSAEGDIADLNTKLGTPEVGADDVITRIASAEGDISDLQAVVGTPAGGADDLVTRLGTLEGYLSDLYGLFGVPFTSGGTLMARIHTAVGSSAVQNLNAFLIQEMLRTVEYVQKVKVYENSGDTADSNGIPAHSIAVVIQDGDDNEIAKTIFRMKAAGAGTYGTTTVQLTDSQGKVNDISFSRASVMSCSTTITIVPGTGFDESVVRDAIKADVRDYINARDINEQLTISNLIDVATLAGPAGTYTVQSAAVTMNNVAYYTYVPAVWNKMVSSTTNSVTVTVVS